MTDAVVRRAVRGRDEPLLVFGAAAAAFALASVLGGDAVSAAGAALGAALPLGVAATVAGSPAGAETAPGRRAALGAVGGHAYAGTRGIDRVEVSVDDGDTWSDADLSESLPGDDVWRQWVRRYDPPEGEHEVVVRAVDGTGTLQPAEESDAFPSGPSSRVKRTVRP